MRLFIGIFPPQEYIRFFADVLQEFDKEKRNLRHVPVDHVHLTLKFVGANVHPEHAQDLMDLVGQFEGQYPKPIINMTRVTFGFSNDSFPKHLIAHVEAEAELLELTENIHKLTRSLKYRDMIRWKPKFAKDFHITLSKLKETGTLSTAKKIKSIAKEAHFVMPEPFYPESMWFIESTMGKNGPLYKKLREVRL
jgi:2'-5' RNA ligase